MIKLHKLVATFFGIGYIGKGGGTVAAVILCICWITIPAGCHSYFRQVFFSALICIIGTWSGNAVDAVWGKDSSKVVIDEVAGMMITLVFIPVKWQYVAAGLVLFRFFDIAKPLGIRKLEALPKGWGVMADDVLAGIYSHIILMLIVVSGILE